MDLRPRGADTLVISIKLLRAIRYSRRRNSVARIRPYLRFLAVRQISLLPCVRPWIPMAGVTENGAVDTAIPKGKILTAKITFGGSVMHWYLVHAKPRQEKCALENLQRQGYECYLPLFPSEKLSQGVLRVTDEPLFPRYLFIRLGRGESAQSWAPIRATKGVSRLVSFGLEPAKVPDSLIDALRAHEVAVQAEFEHLFKPGERVRLMEAPFAGIEGIYKMADGERRVIVLIELLSRQVRLRVAPASLRKMG